MITLKVCSSSIDQIKGIAQFLLEQKLAIDININSINRLNLVNNTLEESSFFELNGKTKALLFQNIDDLIKSKFKPAPEIYSSPIVHMDWEQTKLLAKEIINI